MRLRHIKGAEQQIAESPFVIHDPEEQKGTLAGCIWK